MTKSETSLPVSYHERLWPTVWLYIVLLLLIPSVMLLFMPLNITLGIALAPLVYLFFAALITLTSPVIRVQQGEFVAGRASIPTSYLGTVEHLDSNELSVAIGIKADARAYLLIRGWIHQGLKITNTDPTDPAPYWIVTTRRPAQLHTALEASRSAQQ